MNYKRDISYEHDIAAGDTNSREDMPPKQAFVKDIEYKVKTNS